MSRGGIACTASGVDIVTTVMLVTATGQSALAVEPDVVHFWCLRRVARCVRRVAPGIVGSE